MNNITGPLCNGGIDPARKINYNLVNKTNFNGPRSDICERISNIESSLNIKNENTDNYKTNADIYKKLKLLEDRVITFQNMLLEKTEKLININKQVLLLPYYYYIYDN